MNIAIVAPSSVPYVHGGAENLCLGLQRYLVENTRHHCELFKLVSPERSVTEVVSSYRNFSKLNLDHFDRVISTKYPSWMVRHSNHVVYMLHTLRGVYDTYHFCHKPISLPENLHSTRLNQWMRQVEFGEMKLEHFFDLLQKEFEAPEAEFLHEFPGAASRAIVQFLDREGLNVERIKSYFAISDTVRKREGYFPHGATVGIAYPPPALSGYYCQSDDYLFTTSRLDGPKRIGLLIEAMRHVSSQIHLVIGGTGPDEERLKQLANGDPRIEFVGYLNDRQLLDHYANALAVPFVPYDEDYGLVTIEAMKSGKPVITVSDSGGVNEFVVNHETGLSVPPEPQALAMAIDYICEHRAEAKAMGREAKRRVSGITWEKVAQSLVGDSLPKKITASGASLPARTSCSRRKKMVVALTFPVYPPRGGGQSRVFNLYREWASHYDITLVTLAGPTEAAFEGEIAPGLIEIRIPKSVAHQAAEDGYSASVEGVPITDIVASSLIHLTPEYAAQLEMVCNGVDIVVACHPYLVEVLRVAAPHTELWFEAQDVEYTLKKNILPKIEASLPLLEMVRACEKKAWESANIVFTCAERDLNELAELYGPSRAYQFEVPNGFATEEVQFTSRQMREDVKRQLGLDGIHTTVFMGSWHGPNLDAAECVVRYAEALPAVIFLVIGSAGLAFSGRQVPDNVRFLGVLDEKEKQVVLSAADLAINPMDSGSGSNLKMFDYMAAGVPVLSTAFGARGMAVSKDVHFFEADVPTFPQKITQFFLDTKSEEIDELISKARDVVCSSYSWCVIAKQALKRVSNQVD